MGQYGNGQFNTGVYMFLQYLHAMLPVLSYTRVQVLALADTLVSIYKQTKSKGSHRALQHILRYMGSIEYAGIHAGG